MTDESRPYRIRSNLYTREYIGLTDNKPNAPERNGDIFHNLSTGKSYIGYAGEWYEMTW